MLDEKVAHDPCPCRTCSTCRCCRQERLILEEHGCPDCGQLLACIDALTTCDECGWAHPATVAAETWEREQAESRRR